MLLTGIAHDIFSSEQNENIPPIEMLNLHSQTQPVKLKVFENNIVTVYVTKLNKDTFILALHKNGKQIKIDKELFLAIHEAAHTVAFIEEPSLHIIEKATIVEDGVSAGATYVEPSYIIEKREQELEHAAIGFLAGGIANQIILKIPRFTQIQEIDQYFSNDAYKSDWQEAFKNIVKLVKLQSTNHQIQRILLPKKTYELYCRAYQFIHEHQTSIENLAIELLKEKTLSQNEIYKILGKDLPLYFFEQGPLPESLEHHYQLRERNDFFEL